MACGRRVVPRGPDRGRSMTRDGAGAGEALRKVSPGPESSPVVGPPGEQDSLRIARATPAGVVADRDWYRRYP
jgi:hypothetical protein